MKPIESYPWKECQNCGNQFRKRKPNARFCHDRCRVAFKRREKEITPQVLTREAAYRIANEEACRAEIEASHAAERAREKRAEADKLKPEF